MLSDDMIALYPLSIFVLLFVCLAAKGGAAVSGFLVLHTFL